MKLVTQVSVVLAVAVALVALAAVERGPGTAPDPLHTGLEHAAGSLEGERGDEAVAAVHEATYAEQRSTKATTTQPRETLGGADAPMQRDMNGLERQRFWTDVVQCSGDRLIEGTLSLAEVAELTRAVLGFVGESDVVATGLGAVLLHDETLGSISLSVRPERMGLDGEVEISIRMKTSPGGWRQGDTDGSTMSVSFDLGEGESMRRCVVSVATDVSRSVQGYGSEPPASAAALVVTEEGATWQRVRTLVAPEGLAVDPPLAVYPGFLDDADFRALRSRLVRLRPSR